MNTQKMRRELERDLKNAVEALHRTPQFRAVQAAEEKIARFSEFFENSTPPTTKRAQAPKAKTETSRVTNKGGKKAAARKSDPKTKTPRAAKVPSNKISEGKQAVSRGERPKMKEAVATVIGKGQMSANEVVDALKTRGWLPDSENPRQYMSYVLSTHKDVFETVGRGIYKVKSGVSFAKKANRKVDNTLAEVGLTDGNVGSNPFSSATAS